MTLWQQNIWQLFVTADIETTNNHNTIKVEHWPNELSKSTTAQQNTWQLFSTADTETTYKITIFTAT